MGAEGETQLADEKFGMDVMMSVELFAHRRRARPLERELTTAIDWLEGLVGAKLTLVAEGCCLRDKMGHETGLAVIRVHFLCLSSQPNCLNELLQPTAPPHRGDDCWLVFVGKNHQTSHHRHDHHSIGAVCVV